MQESNLIPQSRKPLSVDALHVRGSWPVSQRSIAPVGGSNIKNNIYPPQTSGIAHPAKPAVKTESISLCAHLEVEKYLEESADDKGDDNEDKEEAEEVQLQRSQWIAKGKGKDKTDRTPNVPMRLHSQSEPVFKDPSFEEINWSSSPLKRIEQMQSLDDQEDVRLSGSELDKLLALHTAVAAGAVKSPDVLMESYSVPELSTGRETVGQLATAGQLPTMVTLMTVGAGGVSSGLFTRSMNNRRSLPLLVYVISFPQGFWLHSLQVFECHQGQLYTHCPDLLVQPCTCLWDYQVQLYPPGQFCLNQPQMHTYVNWLDLPGTHRPRHLSPVLFLTSCPSTITITKDSRTVSVLFLIFFVEHYCARAEDWESGEIRRDVLKISLPLSLALWKSRGDNDSSSPDDTHLIHSQGHTMCHEDHIIPQRLEHIIPEDEKEIQGMVRDALINLFIGQRQHKKFGLPLSETEHIAFEELWVQFHGHCQPPCNTDNFKIDYRGSSCSSWNQAVSVVFVDFMMQAGEFPDNNQLCNTLQMFFFSHIKSSQKAWRESNLPLHDQEM
ncbi:hypothetical protein K488DRAFT_73346 [Vararia minispora EC-137]|uniref:Uncharacterized protein n=1 Tax=Vararia minispora EC-137 TaxID=1314806 RepID=A0ACB8QBP5_9AGAM|nr:hypothetical protein K488DRAFT_73346 [Vararia minispora EC-137]